MRRIESPAHAMKESLERDMGYPFIQINQRVGNTCEKSFISLFYFNP